MAFVSYALLVSGPLEKNPYFIYISLGAVAISTVSLPHLSDDVYRFLWDGELIYHGINPYAYLPQEIMSMKPGSLFDEWYPKLNSPSYYSVYPVACQLLFFLGTLLGKLGLSPVFGIKIMYAIIHATGYFFAKKILHKYPISRGSLALYYLNPLVIVEGIGNMHAEVVMVGFTVMAIFYFLEQRWLMAAILFSLAVATKMTVLMVLPFVFYYAYCTRNFRFIAYCILCIILLFLPIFIGKGMAGFTSSMGLYFRKFEFNASFYYILRYLGQLLTGFNQIAIIGPLLGLVTSYLIVKTSLDKTIWPVSLLSLSKVAVFLLTVHLLCSTTVHPWYLITILFFASVADNKAILIWSYTITWTYIHYNGGQYVENLWVVAAEYLVFFLGLLLIGRNGKSVLFSKDLLQKE